MIWKTILITFAVMMLCEADKEYDFKLKEKYEKPKSDASDKNRDIKAENKFQQRLRMFAALMYYKIAEKTEADENIFFSPMSITHVMGMLNSGAAGNTTKQIKNALQITSYESNAYVDRLMQLITKDIFEPKNDIVKTVMSARGFHVPSYELEKSYIETLKKNYHSEMENMTFIPAEEAANKINEWVADNTNNLIKDLVSTDMFTPLTTMVLVNALYFKGGWTQSFRMAYGNQTFYTPSSNIIIKFMIGQFKYKLKETEDKIQLAIPYKDNKTTMVIVMPKSEEAMKAFVNKTVLSAYFKNLKKRVREWDNTVESRIFVPPFDIEKKTDVKKVLKRMGVRDLFSSKDADLSEMSEEFVYVSDFMHKAKITVDKDGTEAAAGTAAGSTRRTAFGGPIVQINRPFMFVVIEKGNILFMGKIANPTA